MCEDENFCVRFPAEKQENLFAYRQHVSIQNLRGHKVNIFKLSKNGFPSWHNFSSAYRLMTAIKIKTEMTLTTDIAKLRRSFRKWRLQANASNTEACCFHLNIGRHGTKLLRLKTNSFGTTIFPTSWWLPWTERLVLMNNWSKLLRKIKLWTTSYKSSVELKTLKAED